MKKILTVSLFAMMAVSAANADIASTAYVEGQTGTLTNLTTTAKGNLVVAINEVDANIGTVSFTAEGATQGKTNLTEAIAAVDAQVQGLSGDLMVDIAGQIGELNTDITTINNSDPMNSGITSDKVTKYEAYDARITAAKNTADGAVTVNTQQGTAIADNAAAIETLNGNAQTAGSVLKSIADNAVNTVTSGTTNGTIKVDGAEVAVAGLGTAAYTPSSDYATAAQGTKADTAVQTVETGTNNGTIKVDGTEVAVKGLGSAAYTESSAYATSAQGTKADNAVARTQIGAAANFAITDECKAQGAVCSLVVRAGVAGWEKVIGL